MTDAERVAKEKEEADKVKRHNTLLVKKNVLAIAETLKAHGVMMGELQQLVESLKTQVAMMGLEIQQQKVVINKSLALKYGTGPTAS